MPFLGAVGAAIGAFASTAIGSFLIRLAISFVIGAVMQNRMKKKMEAMQRANRPSVMVNTASNNESIPVSYGKTRLGGNRLYTESTNGAGNENINSHLNMIFSLCEGKVNDLEQIWFDNLIVWDVNDATTPGTIGANNELSGFISKFAPALDDAETHIVFFDGDDSQASSSILSTSIGTPWTSAHRLRGVVYCGVVLNTNAEIYKGGLPLMTFTVKGKQIRDVSALPGAETYIGGADENPVDVLYDYMSNPRYGKGLDHNSAGVYTSGLNIDLDSFKAARIQAAGYYKINGVLDTSTQLYDNIGEILESMNGLLVFQNGKYILKLQNRSEATVATFTAFDILSPVAVQMQAKSSKYNKVLADYRNKVSGTDYNDDLVIVDNATYLTEDNGTELEGRIRLDLVDDTALVTDIANYTMDTSRYQQTINFDAAHTALRLQCGEIVEMDLEEFGWGGTGTETGSDIWAGSFVIGKTYKIVDLGYTQASPPTIETDFTAIGAESNNIGVIFIATGVGTGTGKAIEVVGYAFPKPFRITQMGLNPDNSISITATEYISSIELIP